MTKVPVLLLSSAVPNVVPHSSPKTSRFAAAGNAIEQRTNVEDDSVDDGYDAAGIGLVSKQVIN